MGGEGIEGEKNPSQSGLAKAAGSFKHTITQPFGRAEEHFQYVKCIYHLTTKKLCLKKHSCSTNRYISFLAASICSIEKCKQLTVYQYGTGRGNDGISGQI